MSNFSGFLMVIGVSGVGKSTIAKGLANRMRGQMVEADDLHPKENIAAMTQGIPLNDDMRWGWLDKVAAEADRVHRLSSGPTIIACSALKKAYRDRLRAQLDGLWMVYLHGDKPSLLRRMATRQDHYMPITLLDSQFADLEIPTDQEANILTEDVELPVETIIHNVVTYLNASENINNCS